MYIQKLYLVRYVNKFCFKYFLSENYAIVQYRLIFFGRDNEKKNWLESLKNKIHAEKDTSI